VQGRAFDESEDFIVRFDDEDEDDDDEADAGAAKIQTPAGAVATLALRRKLAEQEREMRALRQQASAGTGKATVGKPTPAAALLAAGKSKPAATAPTAAAAAAKRLTTAAAHHQRAAATPSSVASTSASAAAAPAVRCMCEPTDLNVSWKRERSIPIPSCRCDGVRGACVRSRLGVAAALASPCRQAHPHLCSAHAALSRPWLARVPTRSSVARVPYVHERAGFRP
jgi:hypothetical protein